MLRHHTYTYWGFSLAMFGVVLVGCAPMSSRTQTASEGKSRVSDRPGRVGDLSAEKAAAAHAHYAAGVIHEMNDESEAALREYQQAALKDPANEDLVLEVARRFVQNKRLEKATEVLARAASRPEASGLILARLGSLYVQQGKTEQAVSVSRAAIRKAPDFLDGYQNLFALHLQSKQTREALNVLDLAAKQPHTDADFLIGLSELYMDLGKQAPAQLETAKVKALALLNRAAEAKLIQPTAKLRLADGFNSVGESAKAAQFYLEVLKELPDAPMIRERVHARLTDIYLRGQDRQRAAEQLQAIIRDDPTNPLAYYYLGSLAYDEKKLPEAIENFRKTNLLNENFEPVYYELALAQLGLNQTSDALATLAKARQKFAQNFVMEFLTGTAFSRQKAYAEALQHFTAAEVIAKATDPKRLNEEFYFQLGATCERKGDLEQAEVYFQKCLKLAPNFAEAQNYLGYMWAEHGMKLQEARELIEKATKAEPKNAAFLDSLGWVLFKLNQPKEALGHILKAVELNEQPDATLYDHLGDVYAALNETGKAREAWKKSVEIEENEAVKEKLGK
jgi:tetratricopeptide (TPR) repeat protein